MKAHIATIKISSGLKTVTLTDEAQELMSEHGLTADEITARVGYAKIYGESMKDLRTTSEDEGEYHVYLDSFSPSGEVLGGNVTCEQIF